MLQNRIVMGKTLENIEEGDVAEGDVIGGLYMKSQGRCSRTRHHRIML